MKNNSSWFYRYARSSEPTAHPSPFTLHPSLFTLHSSLFTLHPSPFTLHCYCPHPVVFDNGDKRIFHGRFFNLRGPSVPANIRRRSRGQDLTVHHDHHMVTIFCLLHEVGRDDHRDSLIG